MEAAMQIGGSLVKGAASYEAGKYNRAVARQNAISTERDGVADETRIREAARLAIGEQLAAQASSGFQPGTGSALEALTQSQVNATLDALTARRSAAAKARGLRSQGAIAMAEGRNAMTQALIGAGSSAVSASSDWAAARSGSSTPARRG